MTVMVTGASGVLGHAVVSALLARDEVRATVRRPAAAEPLRALGAKVAVLDPHRVCLMPDCGWGLRRRDTVWDKNAVLVEAANIVRERYK